MTESQSNPDFLNNPFILTWSVSARLHAVRGREREPGFIRRECTEAHGKVSHHTGRSAFWDCRVHMRCVVFESRSPWEALLLCLECVLFCVCCRALGVPATDYVMEGRFPVKKLGNVSLPLESPAQETLRLLRRHGYHSQTSPVWNHA